MVDLRPCPFCGSNVRLKDKEFDDFAGSFFTNTMLVIECEKCGISMKRYPKRGYGTTDEQKQDLINSWNRRTEDLTLKEQEAVVRCKDCKYYKDGFCYNPNTYDDEKTRGNTVPDWFCADGERKCDDA